MATIKKYNGSTWENAVVRKYGTSTDTITTLPADLYADGTNATVGLVGNMSQSGTPTPQNPIQPSETGDLVASGEHSGQYQIPISSGGTTTNVYLGEVQSTRQIKKLVLTGEEEWFQSVDPNNKYLYTDIYSGGGYAIQNENVCTHFEAKRISVSNDNQGFGVQERQSGSVTSLLIRYTGITDNVSAFTTYLQQQYANGIPVTVWYVLATSTTGIVNEPLRKIGNYADTVSGITIPTITGKDTFDVDTTLKPSEVSLAYTGWHDASVGEWDGSEWQ